VRISPDHVLIFDGFFGAKFDILKPRWLPTAGVAIVDRAGPGMLRMLQSHTMGDNRARFGEIAERSIAHARKPRAFLQWQLI
jgi:hypothetical protein